MFFFEEKKQKTFVPLHLGRIRYLVQLASLLIKYFAFYNEIEVFLYSAAIGP